MFLKRIELAGFKSFADKTELEFVQGITAVVGPNGSGKSNISDGIRWVLGEQSARSLRGGKMEDIIFAGSDSRKAVNYGEVSLTLDNTDHALQLDFSEVTVTRRVHRSGESEYFINKQSCRLKDITELFMDTGIGKEAYSIIGQGRIEEILSTRSEDRRGIFEEASGIVKYKSRKKEAQKKLDETEQNLLRIHDLVSELEDQIEPLREQSEKATQYKLLREQLRTNEISMYVYQIDQLYRSWTEANEKLNELQKSQLELSTIVNQHDAHLEKHRWETRRLEEQLEQLQQTLLAVSEEFEKCEGHGEVLKERKRNLTQNHAQFTQTAEAQDKRIAERQAELEQFKLKHDSVAAELKQLQDKLHEEEEQLLSINSGTSSAAEERLKAELLDTLNKMAQARNEIKYVEQQKETLVKRVDRLEEDEARLERQKEHVSQKKHQGGERLQEIVEQISKTREQYLSENLNMKAKQELYEDGQQALRKWEQKLDAYVSRRDTMKELQNDYDGFMHGVREVLKSKKRADGLKGIHGAVAELVKVPAKYEAAMETALGGALQHIVMQDEASAREAIAFLKKRQLGRATFLPLNVIKGRFIQEAEKKQAETQEGYIGVAADLIEYDVTYQAIVSSLLGNVIIAEKLEHANRIAAKCQYRYRVVTLEGDVVNAGGSMTGGSTHKKNTSLLGRKREIEQLDKEILSCESQIGQLRNKVSNVKKEIAELGTLLEQLRQTGEQKRIEEQQVRAELNQLETEEKNVDAQLALSAQDRDAHGSEQHGFELRKAQLVEVLTALQVEEAGLQRSIRDAEISRKASESAKEELQAKLTELKVQVAATSQEKQSLQEQVRRWQADTDAATAEHQETMQTVAQLAQELETNRLESLKQIEDLNHYQIKKQETSEKIEFTRAERMDWIKKLEQEENVTREQRVQLKQIEDQLHQTEVRVNRLDVELENILKKLSEEYELSYELAKERHPVPEDVIGTQNKVRELKREIASLGDVNLGAIEEYARINERFHFLSEQKDDLIEAKATLYQVIQEMDEEMSRRFSITFEAIRSQFVIVFAKLFGGGRADLVLSEPNDLLETGIDIVAQPPGKKLQNLQLLSGGERALTAIALLFAILRIKPVPFCVLDEVEAALDDANVTRFAEYLREFSNDTQFIVVTHRKGTMEEADVLYGVTMEEGGVSKLVSVRLEEEEDAVSA